jgi:hypothetical protein
VYSLNFCLSVCFSLSSQEKGFKVEQDLNRGRVLAVFNSLIGKRALELRSTDPRLDQSVKPNVLFDSQKILGPLSQSERSVFQWVCTSSDLMYSFSFSKLRVSFESPLLSTHGLA